MSIPIITILSDTNHSGFQRLKSSAERFDVPVIAITVQWHGFGTKIIELYKFLKNNPDVKEFIFADAYDVMCLDGQYINADADMLFNAEKNCWPVKELEDKYPECGSEWKYLNSGLFYAKSEPFMRMIEENPVQYHEDDQLYYTMRLLSGKYKIALDSGCVSFQAYSFIAEDDFEYVNGLGFFNAKMETYPCMAHGNGTTDMSKLEKLLETIGI